MTWAAERAKLGRHPVIVVELDLDACANVYGTAPCTATAARKCYNTYGTCLDKTHFTKTTKTLRFSSVLMDVSSDAIPSLQSVTYAPTRLDPAQGLALLAQEAVDLVIQDMNFSADTTSGLEGAALFHQLRALQPDMPVILLTAWTHLDAAVDLIKAGAADYLLKPVSAERLQRALQRLHR